MNLNLKKEKQILPQTLLHSLDILHGMVRKLSLLKYLGAIALLCLSSWAFIFSLDRFIDTPQWFRILLSISSLFLIFFFCYQLILEAYILPRSHAWLARRIKDRFGGPGKDLPTFSYSRYYSFDRLRWSI